MTLWMAKFVIAALIISGVSIAHAEIYKCNDINGEVQFSDKPCGRNAKAIELESSNINSRSERVDLNDNPDLLICPGEQGTNLPIKLCQQLGSTDCQFRLNYLRNIITDVNTLNNDLSKTQIDLIKKYTQPGTVIWEFGTRSNEWDEGTGIRGYVVLKKTRAIYFVPVFYQGLPNKLPNGDIRHLPLKGRDYKRCEDRNIMDTN
jgi:Domain of unknown function (DUF4124)